MTRIPASGPARAPASAGAGRVRGRVRSRARALVERFFWLAGLLCVGAAGATFLESYVYQEVENEAFDRALQSRAFAETVPASEEPLGFPPRPASDAAPDPASDPAPDPASDLAGDRASDAPPTLAPDVPAHSVIGRLEIPRLGIRAMVREGVDHETLKVAVGHIPGTARPGETGNVGLAAHRDTFFRALRDVRKGDVMRLTTLEGSETYRVTTAEVVDPAQIGVLAGTNGTRSLTLVTCFPFDFIGAAPKRFVVAALASGDAQRGGR